MAVLAGQALIAEGFSFLGGSRANLPDEVGWGVTAFGFECLDRFLEAGKEELNEDTVVATSR